VGGEAKPFFGGAVLIFMGSIGLSLVLLVVHSFGRDSLSGVVANDRTRVQRAHIGLVQDIEFGMASITLENCQKIVVALPASEAASRLVVVNESRDYASGKIEHEVASYVEYEDFCSVYRQIMSEAIEEGCLTRRCS